MFGKKKEENGEPQESQESKAPSGGSQKVSKGFGNTIILFIVFFIVFTVIVTGVAFFADKIDLAGNREKNLEDIAPAEKMTDPKQGESTEYVMDEKGDIAKKEVMEPILEKKPEPELKIPPASTTVEKPAPKPAPLPPVKVKPEPKKPEPKPEVKKPAPAPAPKPSAPVSLTTASSKGDYVVQIASFKSRDTAEAEARKLLKMIPSIFVVRADLGEKGVWYRIRCFNGIDRPEALSKSAEIARKTRYKPYPMKK